MKSFTLIFLVLWIWNAYYNVLAQITFEKTFGGTQDDWGLSVQQTSDEGYIIAGNTLSFGAGSRDVYLIKTNSLGDTLWTKTFGGIGTDEGHCVRQTYDGGYIITGINGTHFPTKGYLIKTDTTGETLWAKTFDGSGESVIQTSDSVYVIVGTYAGDVYIIKTNSQGEVLWTNFIGGSEADYGFSIQQTNDDGFIIVGATGSFGNGNYDVYLIKTNTNGDTLWTKFFGGAGNDIGYSVQQISDDGYVILGYKDTLGIYNTDIYLIRTDSNGDTLWTKTFGGTGEDRGYSVKQTNDGGYILTGNISGNVCLIKTDADGGTLWTKLFSQDGPSMGFSIQQTRDSGYVIAGSIWNSVYGYFDVYLLKTDDSGIVTEISDDRAASAEYAIFQNYPNPFNSMTNIEFIIPSTGHVVLKIYNIMGQLITTLIDEQQTGGRYNVQWQASNLPSGVYFYRLESGRFNETKKLILLR